jgi:hypothetical protein
MDAGGDEPLNPHLIGISQTQLERLFFIDFRAQFVGKVARADIVARFGVKEAASTRDLALYRSIVPRNLALEASTKAWLRSDGFQPLFSHRADQALTALAEGLGDDAVASLGPLMPVARPLRLNRPDVSVLATVTRAIAGARQLRITYHSLSSGCTERPVSPFALVDTGVRWHMRGWDHLRGRFADFVLTRIEAATLLPASAPPEASPGRDDGWIKTVALDLTPHPGLAHPGAVAFDYGMEAGKLSVSLRAALVGYALQHWNVDATEDHRLDPLRHQLWLSNASDLAGLAALAIAPR